MFAVAKERIKRWQKHGSGTVKTIGLTCTLLGILLFTVALYAFLENEFYPAFLYPAPFFFFPGLLMYFRFSYAPMSSSFGILLMMETWLFCFVAAILPFWFYGFELVDAVYEGISGFTTTGSSIMPDVESADSCVLLWRALIQWAGGIVIVAIFVFLIPMVGLGGKNFGSNELSGSRNGDYSMSVRYMAVNFLKIYMLLTVSEIVLLLIVGHDEFKRPLFDAVCISMSNVPTGGLLPFNTSMDGFGFTIQLVTFVYMILGASNFLYLFRLFFHRDRTLFKSREWKMMLAWFFGVAVFMTVVVWYDSYFETKHIVSTFWDSLYAVACAGTSSGFAIADYTKWPMIAVLLLVVVEFVGGTSGSTAGGIKIYRLMTIKAYIAAGMDKVLHPNAVSSMTVDGSHVDADDAASVVSTVFLFIVGSLVGFGLIVLSESTVSGTCSMEDVIGLTISSISNAGAATGQYGPMASMAPLLPTTKLIMCSLMFLGRMEMVFVLMVFTRKFWRDVQQSSAGIRRKTRMYFDREPGRRRARSFALALRRCSHPRPDRSLLFRNMPCPLPREKYFRGR